MGRKKAKKVTTSNVEDEEGWEDESVEEGPEANIDMELG